MFYGASVAGRLKTRVPSGIPLVLITQKGFSGPNFRLAQQIVVGFDGGPEVWTRSTSPRGEHNPSATMVPTEPNGG